MKRMIKAASLHELSVFEENDEGSQNRISLDGTDISDLIRQALSKMNTGKSPPSSNITTIDEFVDAVDEYNYSPGAWSIVQVKFDGQVVAGLEDDEII